MSRSHPPLLSLAAPFALSVLLLAGVGCGGDSQEEELAEATAAVSTAHEAVQKAREVVEAREQAVNEAQKELEVARNELRLREETLREAESRVGRKATDATVFRSVQRRLLEDEKLGDWAIAAEVTKGVVTLRGTVADEEARQRAEETAGATPGVVSVENRIQVASPSSGD